LIDGPTTGVPRQALAFRRMGLTKLVVSSLPRGATSKIVKKHIEKDGTVAKFGETTLAKKVAARKARDSMTDYDRFCAKLAKQSVNSSTLFPVYASNNFRSAAQSSRLNSRN
jgi:large subunit ribosomal protein L14e